LDTDVRFRIAAARRMLARNGCESYVAGHVSVRTPGEDAFWISPFEYFDETVPSRIIKVGLDLALREGDWEPSPAVQFHASIYQGRPDVGSVVHTHSPHVSAAVTRCEPVAGYSILSALFDGEQAVYVEDGTTPPVEGKLVAAALGDRDVLLLSHHGVILVAPTLEEAAMRAVLLEETARFAVDAAVAGGTRLRASSPERRTFLREQVLPAMWASNMRRLQYSDPDLFAVAAVAAAAAVV
jgi:L-fuculose-phosphate aldolase